MHEREPYRGSAVSRGRIVPLISSYATGPLGLMHLPRLWLKGLLYAAGILAEDWGVGAGGLDRRIMNHAGVDAAAFIPWLLEARPTYAACEACFAQHARDLGAASIARANDELATAPLPRGLGPQFRAYLGITDDALDVGIMLNNLDDWMAVQRYAERWHDDERIVPAIDPATAGPLGIAHLPRLWLKTILRSYAILPDGYALADEPADREVPAALGLDPDVTTRYLASARPAYVQFERWVRAQTRALDAARVAAANGALAPAAIAAAHAYDWELLHRTITALPVPPSSAPLRREGIRPFGWRS